MIVVDTNVLAYLLISGDRTEASERAFRGDPIWVSPLQWRSEFRSVLGLHLRRSLMSRGTALSIMESAELLMRGREYAVRSEQVLDLSNASGCSTYDCEFVALAQDLDLPLLTSDRQLLKQFPEIAVALGS